MLSRFAPRNLFAAGLSRVSLGPRVCIRLCVLWAGQINLYSRWGPLVHLNFHDGLHTRRTFFQASRRPIRPSVRVHATAECVRARS